MRRFRKWLWLRLIYLADRISPEDAFQNTGFSFKFEAGKGVVFYKDERGCPIWYQGEADHRRAWRDG